MKTHGVVRLAGKVIGYTEMQPDETWQGFDLDRKAVKETSATTKFGCTQLVLYVLGGVELTATPKPHSNRKPKAKSSAKHSPKGKSSKKGSGKSKGKRSHRAKGPDELHVGKHIEYGSGPDYELKIFTPRTPDDVMAMLLAADNLGIDTRAALAAVKCTPNSSFTPAGVWSALWGGCLGKFLDANRADREFFDATTAALRGDLSGSPEWRAWIAENVRFDSATANTQVVQDKEGQCPTVRNANPD